MSRIRDVVSEKSIDIGKIERAVKIGGAAALAVVRKIAPRSFSSFTKEYRVHKAASVGALAFSGLAAGLLSGIETKDSQKIAKNLRETSKELNRLENSFQKYLDRNGKNKDEVKRLLKEIRELKMGINDCLNAIGRGRSVPVAKLKAIREKLSKLCDGVEKFDLLKERDSQNRFFTMARGNAEMTGFMPGMKPERFFDEAARRQQERKGVVNVEEIVTNMLIRGYEPDAITKRVGLMSKNPKAKQATKALVNKVVNKLSNERPTSALAPAKTRKKQFEKDNSISM